MPVTHTCPSCGRETNHKRRSYCNECYAAYKLIRSEECRFTAGYTTFTCTRCGTTTIARKATSQTLRGWSDVDWNAHTAVCAGCNKASAPAAHYTDRPTCPRGQGTINSARYDFAVYARLAEKGELPEVGDVPAELVRAAKSIAIAPWQPSRIAKMGKKRAATLLTDVNGSSTMTAEVSTNEI